MSSNKMHSLITTSGGAGGGMNSVGAGAGGIGKQPVAKMPKISRTPRAPRATASAGVTSATVNGVTKVNGASAPLAKSKFTEKKQMLPPLRTRSLRLDLQQTIATANKQNHNIHHYPHQQQQQQHQQQHGQGHAAHHQPAATATTHLKIERKVIIQSLAPRNRVWNRKEPLKKCAKKISNEEIEPMPVNPEIAIQTNEPEILNHELLVGDIKFLLPSRSLVMEIDRERDEINKRAMLKAQRKFEAHAEKQEEHLTDLKEFLEKAVVTKRTRKPREALEYDRKLISSMDEMLCREVPRTESFTDIKSRIKKKEKELLSLFDTVNNVNVLGNKN